MYAPHTVTVYNVSQETDKTTFEDIENIYVTVLHGVFCEASKGANVRDTGLEGADAVNLYIPFDVEAVDGTTGESKTYAPPQEFWAAVDRSALWTLSYRGNGGETFFIKGEYVTDSVTKAKAHDDCYTVTKVDAKDYGSPDMRHFEVGGV